MYRAARAAPAVVADGNHNFSLDVGVVRGCGFYYIMLCSSALPLSLPRRGDEKAMVDYNLWICHAGSDSGIWSERRVQFTAGD